MDTFEAIRTRRSVKHFDADHAMTPAEIDQLLSAAVLAPTSFNMQNWRLVKVTDAARRAAIREAAWDQAQITEASLLLVLCADLQAWSRDPERYWCEAPAEVSGQMVPMMGSFYKGNPELQRDEAMRSTGIIAQTIMLGARAMGYDSCPMIGFDSVKVAEIIGVPEDHTVGMIVVVGKAASPARPRGGQLPLDEVVVENSF